jgi:YD repeat-containing protein
MQHSTSLVLLALALQFAALGANYYYDSSGRLTKVDYGAAGVVRYSYDAAGNLVARQLLAVPVITWPTPAAISYGTLLSATQLDATANVPGTFAYTPPTGAVLPVGIGQTLSVTFTPTDTINYTTATASTAITVNAASSRPIDVSSQVKVTGSGLVFSRATSTYSGTVTILNIGSTPIAAPIQAVFTNLISGATLANQTGTVPNGAYSGAPYITIAGSSQLAPAASVSIPVKFTYTGKAPISYVPKTLSGAF